MSASTQNNLKTAQSVNYLDESRKHSGFLYKRSKTNGKKWLWRYFRWDGETFSYFLNESEKEPKWAVTIDKVISVAMVKTADIQAGISQWVFDVKLIDGSLLELAHRFRTDAEKWVEILNLALNAQWIIAYRECIYTAPEEKTKNNRHARVMSKFSSEVVFIDDDKKEDEPPLPKAFPDSGTCLLTM